MIRLKHWRDQPLRVQLMLMFALLAIATTAVATITLTTLTSQRSYKGLRQRSARIAQRLQLQLEPAIAYDDHQTAREVLDSYAGSEIDGMGVYKDNGELIEGRGERPSQLPSIAEPLQTDSKHVVIVANIQSRENRNGRLYLRFSTAQDDAAERREVGIAAMVGASIAVCAIFLAIWTSRRISRRVVTIADAAKKMTNGDLSHPNLDDSARDEIGALAHAFNVMVGELNRVSLDNQQMVSSERVRLEELVTARTQELEQSREMFRLMAQSTKAIPFTLDLTRSCFTYVGAEGIAGLEMTHAGPQDPGGLDQAIPRELNHEIRQLFDNCGAGAFELVAPLINAAGRHADIRWTGTCDFTSGTKILRGLILDITEVRRLARELSAAQKLESVGRLAAGVAHEINTPVQFVSDNVEFVRTSMVDIAAVVGSYRDLQQAVQSSGDILLAAGAAAETEKRVDLDYILENAPLALVSSIEGLGRIATIVRSMKEFAHPDQGEKTLADLNQAIRSTLVIAHNEYKYVAEVETEWGDLPMVQCHLGEINQVVLNLLVNAAHAITDVVKDSGNRGRLGVRTRVEGNEVEIAISDSGTGIPDAVRDKIFDPFFTTKEVGKGTGQGLALAHNVIVQKHGGSLRFATEMGRGTTFFIRLPIDSPTEAAEHRKAAA
jgi:signal transduction histidine kinase/HAMP domain-containing protein